MYHNLLHLLLIVDCFHFDAESYFAMNILEDVTFLILELFSLLNSTYLFVLKHTQRELPSVGLLLKWFQQLELSQAKVIGQGLDLHLLCDWHRPNYLSHHMNISRRVKLAAELVLELASFDMSQAVSLLAGRMLTSKFGLFFQDKFSEL